ncbi:MAG: hypothetical protein H0V31_01070 [Acidobacteria bacterium]|nr:hypothetical protein [Acidobacteriota bacterium]
MKNTFLKTIGTTVLTILMLATFAQISVSAQDKNSEEESSTQTQEDSSARRGRNEIALEGSWNIQVTRRNCETGAALVTFPTMSTFMRGGTMQTTVSLWLRRGAVPVTAYGVINPGDASLPPFNSSFLVPTASLPEGKQLDGKLS